MPEIKKYLGLPPGWRFLIAPGYEDIWFDEALLSIDDIDQQPGIIAHLWHSPSISQMATQIQRRSGDLHEVWLHANPDVSGNWLPSCVPAGLAGNPARELSEEIFGRGHCVWVFWAESYVEAMSIYDEYRSCGVRWP